MQKEIEHLITLSSDKKISDHNDRFIVGNKPVKRGYFTYFDMKKMLELEQLNLYKEEIKFKMMLLELEMKKIEEREVYLKRTMVL